MATDADYLVLQFPDQLPPPLTPELVEYVVNSATFAELVQAKVAAETSALFRLPQWSPLTLSNGWIPVAPNEFGMPSFRLLANKTLALRGAVTKSSPVDNEVIFSLPLNCCPDSTLRFPASAAGALVQVDIVADGMVRFRSVAPAPNTIVTLASIRFDAGNPSGGWG